jgi:hypothetical protein
MRDLLRELPETINRVFEVLELIVVRLALLALTAVGAYALLHHRP